MIALLGCRSLAELGPKYLKFVDPSLQPPKLARAGLRAVDAKAVSRN